MKKSDVLALQALAVGVILGCFLFAIGVRSIWIHAMFFVAAVGGTYQSLLDTRSKESIINSKSINGE